MSKPTPEEMNKALSEAARLREQGEDEFFLGKSLMNLNYRVKILEDVLHKADLYLHSGEGAHEHAELVRVIEQAREAEQGMEEDKDIKPW